MGVTVNHVISHLAQGNDHWSNETIWKMAWNKGDKQTCQWMLQLKCVVASEEADIDRMNQYIASLNKQIDMWKSGNPGDLAKANIFGLQHASIPVLKKWVFVYLPGNHFSRLIMNVYIERIKEERTAIEAEKQRERDEINRRFQEKLKAEERARRFQKSLENYNSPAEVEKRNAQVRAVYNEKLNIYVRKQQIEEALDEIYFLARAPGDLILPIGQEVPFQRRTKAQKEEFVKTRPHEPTYEEPWELKDGRRSMKLKSLSFSKPLSNVNHRFEPVEIQRRPFQYHEQKLEVFDQIYRIDRRSYLERLERAVETLKGHPLTSAEILAIQKLREVLQAREAIDQAAKLEKEAQLRKEMEQRNEMKLKGRQDDEARFQALQATEKEVLVRFEEEKKWVNTYRVIQRHNDHQAVELFKRLYKADRRSFLGQMQEMVSGNRIRTFAEIEDYACANGDYSESKSRRILREYKPFFDALRYSPLRMQFELISQDEITVKPVSTFTHAGEVQAYAEWYRERCPKLCSDAALIADFSAAYLQHTQERMIPVPFDRLKNWILNGSIFSFKQLKSYAEAHPASVGANILRTALKDQMSELNATDQAFKELKIQSDSYIDPKMTKACEVYTQSFERNLLGVEFIYDFMDRRTETYSPNEGRSGDQLVLSRQLDAALLPEERALYAHFLSTND